MAKALRKAAKGCGAGRGLGRKLRRGAVAVAGEAKSEAASQAANFRLVILSLISTHILRLRRFKSEKSLCNAQGDFDYVGCDVIDPFRGYGG